MTTSHQETEGLNNSNRERIERLEEQSARVLDILSEVNTNMAELRMAMNVTTRDSEEQRRTMEALRRETHENIERIERRIVEGQASRQEANGQRHDALVDGRETSVSGSMHEPRHEPPRHEYRREGRIENDHIAVERWARDDGHHSRSPSTRGEPQDVRFEMPRYEERHEAEYGMAHGRPNGYDDQDHRRHHNHERRRGHRHEWHEEDHYDNRVGNRAHDRGPRRPKVDFPKFNGGDPYEWLDKVDHYFRVYEVPRDERVSTACFHLEGRASKWWRWLRDQYDQDRRRLGWTAFEKEFLMQFGPSPIVNHHGQLAKLKQEGKVHHYVDEFRQLQTMVRGWSE